ncbi:bifunctional metallophosphatase/5'-nucleotidase [Rossellomorea sp. BNER]|uniref:bifunctional metallophosphatase/5'-nucleotidase n=1 Tax=Rossellomorea sp. BNER TaxID=2962031 RepID=UPI003AF2E99C|nr:bifunctional metallophosphatase/5'-nucleotidase [Rossellomorea sp. BNER]
MKTKITILETSDVHGNVYPINYGTNLPQPLGIAKASSLIKRIKREQSNVITIDNGDLIQGTPLTYHYVKNMDQQSNPMIEILNHLEYDAAVIGNHEFNYGMASLKKAVSQSNFPWLSANIVHHSTKETYFGLPYIMKSFDSGIRVAILGVTTHYIPNWESPDHIKDVHFEDALHATKRWVQYIHEEENPDLMVVSYHGGFEKDLSTGEPTENPTGENQGYRICNEVDGIDVLLTGHQHRKLSGEINGVVVVQPGFNGECVAKVDLELKKTNDSWKLIHKEVEILSVSEEESDSEVLDLTHYYEKEAQKWLDQPIGNIDGDMTIKDPFKARLEEHPLVEFINRVQMHFAKVEISNTALFNNSARGLPNNVTMRDIVSNYIYPNTLTVLQITGEDIKAALERSASYFNVKEDETITINPEFSTPKPQHYNYDMWEGIHYVIDLAHPIGDRIVSLNFKGEPINKEKLYEVVMNNYRAGGGGEYRMFQGKKILREIQIDMTELLANYFLEHGVISAEVNHNWRVVINGKGHN